MSFLDYMFMFLVIGFSFYNKRFIVKKEVSRKNVQPIIFFIVVLVLVFEYLNDDGLANILLFIMLLLIPLLLDYKTVIIDNKIDYNQKLVSNRFDGIPKLVTNLSIFAYEKKIDSLRRFYLVSIFFIQAGQLLLFVKIFLSLDNMNAIEELISILLVFGILSLYLIVLFSESFADYTYMVRSIRKIKKDSYVFSRKLVNEVNDYFADKSSNVLNISSGFVTYYFIDGIEGLNELYSYLRCLRKGKSKKQNQLFRDYVYCFYDGERKIGNFDLSYYYYDSFGIVCHYIQKDFEKDFLLNSFFHGIDLDSLDLRMIEVTNFNNGTGDFD